MASKYGGTSRYRRPILLHVTPAEDDLRMIRRKATVFIVDDDESVRKSLERLLVQKGFNIQSFGNASDFLGTTLPEPPSCALVDLRLPEIDGLELQRRQNARHRYLPIVFMSGYGDVPSSVRAMKQGATDFLTKPFDEKDLLRAVTEAVERDRQNQMEHQKIESVRARIKRLTPREYQVFREILTGKLNKQIAATLGITEKTVKVHRQRVMQKTQVRSVAELVRLAGQIPPD